jgi:ATP-dependent helicase HrpA
MRDEDLVRDGAPRVDPEDFPPSVEAAGIALPLEYAQHEAREDDGLTVRVPVEALAVLDPAPFEWLVPGLLAEKVEALVRSLPKHLRVRLFPIEEVVAGACEMLAAQRADGRAGSLKSALARHLERVAQCPVAATDFRDEMLAPHLRMRFAVLDADGTVLATGRDLEVLTARFAGIAHDRLRAAIDPATDAVAGLERDAVDALPDEPLAESIRYRRAGIELTGFPSLVIEWETEPGAKHGTVRERVALRVLDSAFSARDAHAAAVGVLAARELRDAVEHHVAYDALCEDLVARVERWQGPLPGALDAVEVVARLVAAQAIAEAPRAPRSAAEFSAMLRAAGRDLHDRVSLALRTVHALLGEGLEVLDRLRGVRADAAGGPRERVLARLCEVLPPANITGIASCARDELAQRLRLVTMLRMRLERSYAAGESRDREIDDELSALRVRVQAARAERGRSPQSLDAIRAMFEELEIGRFAPKIPRRFAASERRLLEMLERAETGNARNARDAR